MLNDETKKNINEKINEKTWINLLNSQSTLRTNLMLKERNWIK
jgi:hypothetical protein